MCQGKQKRGVLPHWPSNIYAGETTRKSRVVRCGWIAHYHYIPFGQRSGEFKNQHCMVLDERSKWNGYPTTLIGKL